MGTRRWEYGGLVRVAVCLMSGASLLGSGLQPSAALAAAGPAPVISPAMEAGIKDGQREYDSSNFLAAARTWSRIGGEIPESRETRDIRKGLFEQIGRAYHKAAINRAEESVLKEAIEVLDTYCRGFEAAYSGTPVSARVVKSRDDISALLAERATRTDLLPVVGPEQLDGGEGGEGDRPYEGAEPPPSRPPPSRPVQEDVVPGSERAWKPLAIGGGASLGAGAVMATLLAVGAGRARSLEGQYNDMCSTDGTSAECGDIDQQGLVANRLQIAALITAPLLLGAGVAMVVVAMKRKSKGRHGFVPLLGPRAAGLLWTTRF